MSSPRTATNAKFRPSMEALGERLAPAVFTVTSAADSGTGTLRWAIQQANATSGYDTIAFNLPTTGGTTISPASELPEITDQVLIDGWTQPGATWRPTVELNGSLTAWGTDGLRVGPSGHSSTIRGLVVNRFGGDGIELRSSGANRIEGNYIGCDASGTRDQGNRGHGVHVNGGVHDRIARNRVMGNDGSGVAIRNYAIFTEVFGNSIGSDGAFVAPLVVGNGTGVLVENSRFNFVGEFGNGNVISGNAWDGVNVRGSSEHTRVHGNQIGTNWAGTVAVGNHNGVVVNGGRFTDVSDNVIAGNRGSGVVLTGGARDNDVDRNRIGVSRTYWGADFPMGNAGHGVYVTGDSSGNSIGQGYRGEYNTIAYNGGDGVYVESGRTNRIFGNWIFRNGGLGIDLGPNGATANDVLDRDSGANGLQNAPVLDSGLNGLARGTIRTAPNADVWIELFESTTAGVGGRYVGGIFVRADASGFARFEITGLGVSATDRFYTATASTWDGTSESSAEVLSRGYNP